MKMVRRKYHKFVCNCQTKNIITFKTNFKILYLSNCWLFFASNRSYILKLLETMSEREFTYDKICCNNYNNYISVSLQIGQCIVILLYLPRIYQYPVKCSVIYHTNK